MVLFRLDANRGVESYCQQPMPQWEDINSPRAIEKAPTLARRKSRTKSELSYI